MIALRALLGSLIDYAGLYPPSSLPMQTAMENYARYRESPESWMLGRFVVPVARLNEVVSTKWPLSGVGYTSDRTVDSLEIKVTDAAQIESPGGRTVYFEVTDLSLIPAIHDAGARAKIRTGGVTPAAFPEPAFIARFLEACAKTGTPFKATAGLHHPLRSFHPPEGWMYGFLNVFLAAVFVRKGVDIEPLLIEESIEAFSFTGDFITWAGHSATTEEITATRRDFAISFGSCSFEEPVADLKALNLI